MTCDARARATGALTVPLRFSLKNSLRTHDKSHGKRVPYLLFGRVRIYFLLFFAWLGFLAACENPSSFSLVGAGAFQVPNRV